MIDWRVLVPFRQGANGKSRLALVLSGEERHALALRMARHVLAEMGRCPSIADLAILSSSRPEWWDGGWVEDHGTGLNPEIAAWRDSVRTSPIVIVHADLPLLRAREVSELLALAAVRGAALATDRAGQGTNALAISDGRPFGFCFGPGSRALHAEQAPGLAVLDAPGLAADIDTPDDLAFVRASGFTC